MHTLYSLRQNGENSEKIGQQMFVKHITNIQNSYFFSIKLIQALDQFLITELNLEESKYYPSKEKIRTHKLLNKNKLLSIIDATPINSVDNFNSSWNNEGEAILTLYRYIVDLDFCKDYLVFEEPSFEQSKDFLLKLIATAFKHVPEIDEALNNAFITWHDDKKQVVKAVLQTISQVKENDLELPLQIIPMQDNEEIVFGKRLVEKVLINQQEMLLILDKHIKNWDVERMAQTDQLLILLAYCEFIYFEDIPLKVTINEYLEVSKQFSTPQSSKFLNGVLDSLKNQLTHKKKINKNEKGLREM